MVRKVFRRFPDFRTSLEEIQNFLSTYHRHHLYGSARNAGAKPDNAPRIIDIKRVSGAFYGKSNVLSMVFGRQLKLTLALRGKTMIVIKNRRRRLKKGLSKFVVLFLFVFVAPRLLAQTESIEFRVEKNIQSRIAEKINEISRAEEQPASVTSHGDAQANWTCARAALTWFCTGLD